MESSNEVTETTAAVRVDSAVVPPRQKGDPTLFNQGAPSPPNSQSVTSRLRRKAHNTIHHNGHHILGSSNRKHFKNALAHPRRTLAEAQHTVPDKVTKTAAREAANELPQSSFSLEEEEEFVKAWDELGASIREDGRKEDIENKCERVKELERRRNNLRIKWTLRRHVRDLEVVHVERPKRFPDIRDYSRIDQLGRHEVDFSKWLERSILYCTADLASHYVDPWTSPPEVGPARLYSTMERLLAASSPWQEWAMAVRAMYRWDDPWKTFRWMSAYFLFWYLDLLPLFIGGYIIFNTLLNYFHPSQNKIKATIARSKTDQAHAQQLAEIIQQHKDGSWVYPLAQQLGPLLQLQLYDMACLLEIIRNFYEWKEPEQTARSLAMMAAGVLACMILPTHLLVKGALGGMGLVFFVAFPISSRFPRYRLLVSPARLLFWDIPDDVGWAIRTLKRDSHQLQGEAQLEREVTNMTLMTAFTLEDEHGLRIPLNGPLYEIAPREDIYHFPCSLNGKKGQLKLMLTDIEFFPDEINTTAASDHRSEASDYSTNMHPHGPGPASSSKPLSLDLRTVVHVRKARPATRILNGMFRIPLGEEVKKGTVRLKDDCGCKWTFAGLNVPEEEVLVRRVVGAGGWRWVGGV